MRVPISPFASFLFLKQCKGGYFMKKIASLIVLALFLFGSVTAYAAEARWIQAQPDLSFSGTTALCEVSVVCYGDIDVTLSLWQGKTLVDQWTQSGSSMVTISESCTVQKGKSYRLTVSGTANGEPVSGSVSGTC